MKLRFVLVLGLLLALFPARPAGAYSVLTHEQLIDLTWDSAIVPLLLSRYPTLTHDQIEQARAYAYGGCVIQDLGYYPFGDPFFSDLTHYVRTGDFVVNLFRNAGNANELAFAVGALSHYIGDSIGHATATNLAVPIEFPSLRKRYGNRVNYAEGAHQHVQTEFAFDINELSHHRFAPVHYLRHVGLQVPTRQVELAFFQTYGIRRSFGDTRHHRINVRGYNWAVRRFIPRIAYATVLLHRSHEPADPANDPDIQRLSAEIAEVSAKNDWDAYRKNPGIGTYLLAGVIFIVPKFGPLKLVSVKGPTAQTEAEYVHSVLESADELSYTMHRFTPPPSTRPTADIAAAADTARHPESSDSVPAKPGAFQVVPRHSLDPQHPLINRDLDTGSPVKPAGYRLTDQTYATLLHDLAQYADVPVPPGIKEDILAYYADLSLPFATKKNPAAWEQLQADLVTFRKMSTTVEPEALPVYEHPGEADPSGQAAPQP